MFTKKLKLPMRYMEGSQLSTEGVLFYQDGGCIQLGRDLEVCAGLTKEKLVSMTKDRVTEWVMFKSQGHTYVTSMKVFRYLLSPSNPLLFCEKYLFTKAIENLLWDTKMSDTNGLMSAQMFKLENAISHNPVFESDEEEIFFNFDRCSYVDHTIEKLLLHENDHPLLPVAKDLIMKKQVSGDILADNDDYEYLSGKCIVQEAVQELTVPIKQYLATAPCIEKTMVSQLSPYQYQPKMIQAISARVNVDCTPFYDFRCPLAKDDINRRMHLDSFLYGALDTFDNYEFNVFGISYIPNEEKFEIHYLENSYWRIEPPTKLPRTMEDAFRSVAKWYNWPCDKISICKTLSEEIYIDVSHRNGLCEKFYIDIPIFDLMAHNLIDQ